MTLVSGNLQLTFADQEPMQIAPGNYIYGPAELPHEGFCAEGDSCVLFIAFELPVDAIPVEQIEQTWALLNPCMKVLEPLTLALSRRAREQSFEALLPGEKGLG